MLRKIERTYVDLTNVLRGLGVSSTIAMTDLHKLVHKYGLAVLRAQQVDVIIARLARLAHTRLNV